MRDNDSRLDPDQLRIQAKELLKAVRSADLEALARAKRYFEPDHEFKLTNAQLVIARENGFSSWLEMRNAIGESHRPDPLARLFAALDEDDLEQVEDLIAISPNLAQAWRKSEYGWESALHVAAKKGSLPIAKALVEAGADIYPVRQGDYPPVFESHYSGNKQLTRYLLNVSSERDSGPPTYGFGIDIVCAARIGILDRVKMHLERDPFAVYRRGCIGESVLHWPAHNGFVEVVQTLLDAGAVIEADEIGLYGGKPLHWASEHSPTTTRLLLDRGANPMSRNLMANDFEAFTPLHMCASQREQCVEVAQMLLDAGADPKALDAKGRTPEQVAIDGEKPVMSEFLSRYR